MLASLQNVPKSSTDWSIWSFHHRLSHQAIRQAIMAQKGVNLSEYLLDPIDFTDIGGFLQRNQQSHVEMDGALGFQSEDLQTVDLKDEEQKIAWIDSHWQEHSTAEQALGI